MKVLLKISLLVLFAFYLPMRVAVAKNCPIMGGNGEVVREIKAGDSECNGKNRYTCQSSGTLTGERDEECILLLRGGYSDYNGASKSKSKKDDTAAAEEDAAENE
jgi:hypothetical protein